MPKHFTTQTAMDINHGTVGPIQVYAIDPDKNERIIQTVINIPVTKGAYDQERQDPSKLLALLGNAADFRCENIEDEDHYLVLPLKQSALVLKQRRWSMKGVVNHLGWGPAVVLRIDKGKALSASMTLEELTGLLRFD